MIKHISYFTNLKLVKIHVVKKAYIILLGKTISSNFRVQIALGWNLGYLHN